MQSIQYHKEGRKRYMVLPLEDDIPEGYRNSLMQYHKVPFFCSYTIRDMNNQPMLYCHLQYPTPLSKVIGHMKFTPTLISNIIQSIIGAIKSLEEYMLNEEDVVWTMDYVWIEPDTGKMCFSYIPGYGKGTVKELVSGIMEAAGKKDENILVLLLQFYNLITESDCTLERLEQFQRENLSVNRVVREDIIKKEVEDEMICSSVQEPDKKWITKKQNGSKEQLLLALIILVAIADFFLLICLLCNVFTYNYMQYLFGGMAVLIVLTILYMNISQEEDADVIMQEYFESHVSAKNNVLSEDNIHIEQSFEGDSSVEYGETSVLVPGENEEKEQISIEDEPGQLCLLPMGKSTCETIRIAEGSAVIGCMEEGCDYVLKERGISRMHAKIMKKMDGLYVLDLNSTNGTYINGDSIQSGEEYKLEEGDGIAFAQIQYCVVKEI